MASNACTDDQLAALTGAGLTADAANAICANFASSGGSTVTIADFQFGVDCGWLVLTGALVFVMHGGFAMVSLRVPHTSRSSRAPSGAHPSGAYPVPFQV
jgi:hypothetical protein